MDSVKLPKPHAGQQQVLDSNARWKVLMCGRRWGKTLICQIISILKMLDGKHVAYVTPSHEKGREFYQEIIKLIPADIIARDNQTDRTIELITGGSIKFFSGEALDAFRGSRFHTIIVDEAAFIQDLKTAWNKAIRPTLTDYRGDAIFISTPNGKDFFYSLYMKGKNAEPAYESFHFTSYQNPTLPFGEIDEARKELSEAEFNQEYLAIAGENAANPFGTDVIRRNTITTLSNKTAVVYGIDVAKTFDFTVIIGLDEDGAMCYFDRFQGPWMDTRERIASLPGDILKVMDSTGSGDVLYEELQLTCMNLIGYVFTAPSKTNLVRRLIKDVQEGKLKYNETTADEMHVFKYTRTADGYIKYAASAGYHDDCVMSLALANLYKEQAVAAATWTTYSC